MEKNQLEEAMGYFNHYLKYDSLDTDILFNRAICLQNTNQLQLAIDDYSRILDQKDWDRESYYQRALCYYQLGNIEATRADCDSMLRNNFCVLAQ